MILPVVGSPGSVWQNSCLLSCVFSNGTHQGECCECMHGERSMHGDISTRWNVVSACMEACLPQCRILNSSCMGIQYQAEDTNMCWRNLYSYYAFDDLIAYGFLEKGAGFTLGVSALFLRHNIHNFYKWFLEISHLGVCIASWLRSSLWLQFKPHHIAAGAAFLAAKFLNFDLASYQTMWQEFQTTPTILQDVVQQLMELF